MATAIRDLTRLGTDVRQIARLLQKKAPPGHKLAYINEEEAKLLKSRGGSGRITEAGIPSYELDESLAIPGAAPETGQNLAPTQETPVIEGGGGGGAVGDTFSAAPTVSSDTFTSDMTGPGVSTFGQGQPLGTGLYNTTPLSAPFTSTTPSTDIGGLGSGTAGILPAQPETQPLPTPDTSERPLGPTPTPKGLSDKTLATLGIGGLQALLGASQVRQAQAQGQAAQQALQQQALPYQQQGQQLVAQSQQGMLTPANQQILQAAQAQAAQNTAARGGVGALQAQNQINALSQQLLANQLNLGLQLQSVGDKIAQGAIQAGVQADQYVNQLTSSYAQNLARTLTTAATGVQPTQTITLGGAGQ